MSTLEATIPSPMRALRAPFGWRTLAIPVPGAGGLPLRPEYSSTPGPVALRFTTAIDDREIKRVVAFDRASGARIADFDLRYAHALETFESSLDGPPPEEIRLELETGTSPLWIVDPEETSAPRDLRPQFVADGPPADPAAALLGHLASPGCLHTWGWMEGCVLDGQERMDESRPRLGYADAARSALARFFPADGSLRAETSRSEPSDNAVDCIESTLMFAALARWQPESPWLDRVIAFWRQLRQPDGLVIDWGMVSAEGSYTIAYPMARLARLRRDGRLADDARRQLSLRRRHLWHEGALWLRFHPDRGERTFRLWARGIAWHFLGEVRTAQELGTADAEARREMARLADLVLALQRQDGLWSCFIDDHSLAPDTSGTAGIAAALAVAAGHGWIEAAPALAAARRSWQGLLPWVRVDGRLGGVAQSNRGGEELQRSSYRVLSPMAAGLAGQLYASILPAPPAVRRE